LTTLFLAGAKNTDKTIYAMMRLRPTDTICQIGG
jgi:hypothetical protein